MKPFDQTKSVQQKENTCGWNEPSETISGYTSPLMSLSKAWNTRMRSRKLALHFKGLSSKEIQLTLPILSAPAFFPNQCEPFATFSAQKTHFPRPFWLKKISVRSLSSREVFQMFHQLQRCILILPAWAKVGKLAKV